MRERVFYSDTLARGFEHAQSFGHDFFSDAISRNDCNFVGVHLYEACSPFLFFNLPNSASAAKAASKAKHYGRAEARPSNANHNSERY
jgi:hypothetical protein